MFQPPSLVSVNPSISTHTTNLKEMHLGAVLAVVVIVIVNTSSVLNNLQWNISNGITFSILRVWKARYRTDAFVSLGPTWWHATGPGKQASSLETPKSCKARGIA